MYWLTFCHYKQHRQSGVQGLQQNILTLTWQYWMTIKTIYLQQRWKLTGDSSRWYQKTESGIESIVPLRTGFNLLIRRLSLRSSSEAEGEKDNISKSEKEMEWPVSILTKHSHIQVLTSNLTTTLNHLKSICFTENSRLLKRHKNVQEKKLFCLHKDFTKWSTLMRSYSIVLKGLLARGLNFSLLPRRLRFVHFLIPFKMLYHKLTRTNLSQFWLWWGPT